MATGCSVCNEQFHLAPNPAIARTCKLAAMDELAALEQQWRRQDWRERWKALAWMACAFVAFVAVVQLAVVANTRLLAAVDLATRVFLAPRQ
jgi:hypothetical protein